MESLSDDVLPFYKHTYSVDYKNCIVASNKFSCPVKPGLSSSLPTLLYSNKIIFLIMIIIILAHVCQ